MLRAVGVPSQHLVERNVFLSGGDEFTSAKNAKLLLSQLWVDKCSIVGLRSNNRSRCTHAWQQVAWETRFLGKQKGENALRGIKSLAEQPRFYPAGPVSSTGPPLLPLLPMKYQNHITGNSWRQEDLNLTTALRFWTSITLYLQLGHKDSREQLDQSRNHCNSSNGVSVGNERVCPGMVWCVCLSR
jgi:hypothetical protein